MSLQDRVDERCCCRIGEEGDERDRERMMRRTRTERTLIMSGTQRSTNAATAASANVIRWMCMCVCLRRFLSD